jgi:trehalose 6-phosphate synthase/phosphatase
LGFSGATARPRPIPQSFPSHEDARFQCRFWDYDGTLVSLESHPDLAVPSRDILDKVRRVAVDPRNRVVIISGRERQFLDRWFGDIDLVLVAEHGAFLRTPPGAWIGQIEPEPAWKDSIYPLLNRYVSLCPGAFIEEKTFSLAWHYRNAVPAEAAVHCQELMRELRRLAAPESRWQVLPGHFVIEVKLSGYDKGTAVSHLLNADSYDFILAVGDDWTDEVLFRALPAGAFTFKIGIRPSLARYMLRDPFEASRLLDLLGHA